jgi:hypothetical protein
MMGMPNITLQYSFDLQESIQNGRKSGRFMSRIADCNIVNGWYRPGREVSGPAGTQPLLP